MPKMTPRESCASASFPRSAAWQRHYRAVLSEPDVLALFLRVEVAEASIRTCLADPEGRIHPRTERLAMEDALAHLSLIKRERLKFCESFSDLRPQTSDLRPQTSDLRPQTSDLLAGLNRGDVAPWALEDGVRSEV